MSKSQNCIIKIQKFRFYFWLKQSQTPRDTGMLLFFTGIRGCDISCMELSDIDWEKEEICIIQQKTANGLTLPMSVAVGNAIYDYVTMERPSSEEAYVFLCMIRPYRPPPIPWLLSFRRHAASSGIRAQHWDVSCKRGGDSVMSVYHSGFSASVESFVNSRKISGAWNAATPAGVCPWRTPKEMVHFQIRWRPQGKSLFLSSSPSVSPWQHPSGHYIFNHIHKKITL